MFVVLSASLFTNPSGVQYLESRWGLLHLFTNNLSILIYYGYFLSYTQFIWDSSEVK